MERLRSFVLSPTGVLLVGLAVSALAGLVLTGAVPYRRYLMLAGIASVAVALVLIRPRLAVWAYLLSLPFYSFLPVATHQLLLFGGLAALFAFRYGLGGDEGRREGEADLGFGATATDWLVASFLMLGALSLIHGLFRVQSSLLEARFIAVLFANFAASVGAYYLARVWWSRYGVEPAEMNRVLLLAISVNLALFFWFMGSQGWDVRSVFLNTLSGAELRAEIFYRDVEEGYTLMDRLALLPGGTNGKALLFTIGCGMVLPLFVRAGTWARKVLFTGFLVVAVVALLITSSRTSWIALAGMIALLTAMGLPSRPTLLAWLGIGAAAILAGVNLLGAETFFDRVVAVRVESASAEFFAPQGRYQSNLDLLDYLAGNGGIVWGVGFGVVEHQLETFRSTFNPHNIFTWSLANGGILMLALQAWVVVRLLANGVRLWRLGDEETSLFGLQTILVGGTFALAGVFFLYTKWQQYHAIFWIFLGVSEAMRLQVEELEVGPGEAVAVEEGRTPPEGTARAASVGSTWSGEG